MFCERSSESVKFFEINVSNPSFFSIFHVLIQRTDKGSTLNLMSESKSNHSASFHTSPGIDTAIIKSSEAIQHDWFTVKN